MILKYSLKWFGMLAAFISSVVLLWALVGARLVG